MFEPKRRPSGSEGMITESLPLAANQAVSKGMPLTPVNGYLTVATNATTTKLYIAAESKITGAAVSKIEVYAPDDIIYEVPYKGTVKQAPVAADMFTTMDMDADGLHIQLDAQAVPKNQFVVLGMSLTQRVLYVMKNPGIGAVAQATIASTGITDATAIGKTILTAEDAAAVVTAISAELPQSAAQADSVAADAAGIVTDFNSLLAKLRTAGLLATE